MPDTEYLNKYQCHCGYVWHDVWDSMCDDKCPVCNTAMSPYTSIELERE